jgi:uncharacterized repeat protein (TIGR01451 family)
MRANNRRWLLALVGAGLTTWFAATAVARPGPPAVCPCPVLTPVAATDPAARQEPAVSLDWAGPPAVRVNKPAAYTLSVKNTSAQFVQKVVVQVRAAQGATISDTKPAARRVDGVHLWELGTLEPGECRPLALTVTTAARGELHCQAWVTFTGTAGMTARVQEPKLEARVEAPAKVEIGETFRVKHTVRNTGDCVIEKAAIEVRDSRDDPSQLLTGRVWAGDRLAPGEEQAGNPVYVTPTAPGWYEYETIAVGADGVRATAKTRVHVLAPKLDLSLIGPAGRLVGRRAAYTVTVRNAGDLAADGTEVSVPVPAGFRDVTPLDGGRADAGRLVWAVGRIHPGQDRAVRFEATAAAPGAHPVRAQAFALKAPRPVLAECRTVVDGIPALRVEVLDTADPVEVGQETTYEVKVTNTGTKPAADVRLVCDLPAELRFVSAAGPSGAGAERVGVEFGPPAPGRAVRAVAFDPVAELAPRTEAVFRVRVRAEAVGDARFKAVITSGDLSAPVVKEESTRVYRD